MDSKLNCCVAVLLKSSCKAAQKKMISAAVASVLLGVLVCAVGSYNHQTVVLVQFKGRCHFFWLACHVKCSGKSWFSISSASGSCWFLSKNAGRLLCCCCLFQCTFWVGSIEHNTLLILEMNGKRLYCRKAILCWKAENTPWWVCYTNVSAPLELLYFVTMFLGLNL